MFQYLGADEAVVCCLSFILPGGKGIQCCTQFKDQAEEQTKFRSTRRFHAVPILRNTTKSEDSGCPTPETGVTLEVTMTYPIVGAFLHIMSMLCHTYVYFISMLHPWLCPVYHVIFLGTSQIKLIL